MAWGLGRHEPTCCSKLRVAYLDPFAAPHLLRLADTARGCEAVVAAYTCAERATVRNRTLHAERSSEGQAEQSCGGEGAAGAAGGG